MEQITIKIDDIDLKKMRERMIEHDCPTLSQCARDLIKLALRIEEAASQREKHEEDNDLAELKDLFKTNMIWSLETRFLVRILMEKCKEIEPTQTISFMEKAKERATIVVDELMKKDKNIESDD